MSTLGMVCATAACLWALVHWARAVPTRAWGDGPADGRGRQGAWAFALATLALQGATATAAAGLAAGVGIALASWMVPGWALVLAMNQWPQGSLRWARRLGMAGWAGCVLSLLVHRLS